MNLIKFGRRESNEQSLGTSAASAMAEKPAVNEAPQTVQFDAATLREAGLLSPSYEGFKLAREYRQVKRPLIARALGRGMTRTPKGHLIMVASAVSGEGKSFTAVNLALSLSLEKDLRVLLVDADLIKPHISRVLGLAEIPGLVVVLSDPHLDVEHVIRPTNIAKLSLLPAGRPCTDANELLSSQRMEQVIAALGERDGQRIVVFDSPPLLQSNESQALAHVVGQIVIVVQAGVTPQPLLLDALEGLKDHGGLSLVLNQSIQAAASNYYYYGYGSERAEPTEAS